MIKKSRLFGNKTRVTFCLPGDVPAGPVSVPLPPGHYSFRYLASDGVWLDDDHADSVGPHGSELRL